MFSPKRFFTDLLYDIVGSMLLGIGIYCFVNPANIAPGGVSGISIMLNYVFGIPIGTMNFIQNIPIMAAGFIFLSRRMIYKTLMTVFISSAVLDTVVTLIPIYMGDRLLASVFGGILIGAGMGVIFLRGSTTGGTDVISYMVKKLHPQLQIGTAILLTDFVILTASVFVFEDIESGLYGLITIFCASRVIDIIIYGGDRGNLVIVISDKYEQMRKTLTAKLQHGIAVLDTEGGHSGKSKKLILCAVRKNRFPVLKALVQSVDADAFLVAASAEQILGDGFRSKSGE